MAASNKLKLYWKYETLCTIWYYLQNLKNVTNSHDRCFPVNIAKFSRTAIFKNIYRKLLLKLFNPFHVIGFVFSLIFEDKCIVFHYTFLNLNFLFTITEQELINYLVENFYNDSSIMRCSNYSVFLLQI